MREQATEINEVHTAFGEAERVELSDGDGRVVRWVVLAVMAHEGEEFAYATREDDLGRVAVGTVYRYATDGDGRADLRVLDDDDAYDGALHAFQDLWDDELA